MSIFEYQAKPAEIEIVNPRTGLSFEPLPLKIRVQGIDSDAFQRELIALRRDLAAKPDELDTLKRTNIFLASAIVGWEDEYNTFFIHPEKNPEGKFSYDFALWLLQQDGFQWFREQLDKKIADRNAFFPTASIN